MKATIEREIFGYDGLQLRINNPAGCKSYPIILKKLADQMMAMLSHHNKVLCLRLDLHVSEYSDDNRLISRFLEKIKLHLSTQYGGNRTGHLWAREKEKSEKQHYHLLLLIDANKIRHPSKLIRWIEERWISRGQPKPFTPKHCFQVINRGDQQAFQKVFYRASYLAKERGKSHRRRTTNDYSASRIELRN